MTALATTIYRTAEPAPAPEIAIQEERMIRFPRRSARPTSNPEAAALIRDSESRCQGCHTGLATAPDRQDAADLHAPGQPSLLRVHRAQAVTRDRSWARDDERTAKRRKAIYEAGAQASEPKPIYQGDTLGSMRRLPSTMVTYRRIRALPIPIAACRNHVALLAITETSLVILLPTYRVNQTRGNAN
jgi:hypothetical protein